MSWHRHQKQWEAIRLLRLAMSANYFPMNGPDSHWLQLARDLLGTSFTMIKMRIYRDSHGHNPYLRIEVRKHWRRYARRHNINPNTGVRRG